MNHSNKSLNILHHIFNSKVVQPIKKNMLSQDTEKVQNDERGFKRNDPLNVFLVLFKL